MRMEPEIETLCLPADVLAGDDKVLHDVKLVYGCLCTPERRRRDFVELSINELAQQVGKGERTIVRCLDRLKEERLIRALEKMDGTAFFVLTPPARAIWTSIKMPKAVLGWPGMRGATQFAFAELWIRGSRGQVLEVVHSELLGGIASNHGKRYLRNLVRVGLATQLDERHSLTVVRLVHPDRAREAFEEDRRRSYARKIARRLQPA